LTSVVGVIVMVRLPAGKASLETTRSGPTMLSVTMIELLASKCAKLGSKAIVHSITDGMAQVN
jgi:hypothetical protein